MNLGRVMRSVVSVIFNLGSDVVKTATYVRPPKDGAAEVRASVSVIVGSQAGRLLGNFIRLASTSTVLVQVSQLTSIGSLAKGDYIELADGTRYIVAETPVADMSNVLYSLKTELSSDEDWGDLSAYTSSEDWGDLTAVTTSEDWGSVR
jgi:hypothetical protein